MKFNKQIRRNLALAKAKLKRLALDVQNVAEASTSRRWPSVLVLFKLGHPLIAARLLLPGVFIGIVGSIGLVATLNYNPPSAHALNSTANVWIDSDGGSCTRSVSASIYDSAAACSSMQAAMTAAQGGDTVIIKSGTYPAQSITSGTKLSVVSFYAENYTPAVNAADAYSATTSVYVSSLALDGVDKIHIYGVQATPAPDNSRTDAHLTYAHGGNLDICYTGCSSTATTDILVDGFHGRNFFGRVTNVVIDHASFGGWDACYDTAGNHLAAGNSGTEDGFRFWTGTGGSPTPTDSVLRNSVIHDIIMGVNDSEESNVCTFGSSQGPHADCMQNNGGAGITIENNIFFNCPSSDIQWNPFSGAGIGSQIIQNNYFGGISGTGNGTVLGAQSGGTYDCSGIVDRNNFYNGVGINYESAGCTNGDMEIYGNIFTAGGFSAQNANYHDNVFESLPLGTNAISCTPSFVSAPQSAPDWLAITTPNFHLAASDTCAQDHGYSAYPATDFEGDARPQGALADAGPDEVVSTANVWVSTTGNDSTCVRGDQGKPCATVQKACDIAQGGDVIQIATGTYSSGFNLAGCHPSSTITYQNVAGDNVTFQGASVISDTSNVTMQGDRVGHGIGFSLGTVNISGTDAAPTSNINWNKINLYCQSQSPWTVITSSLTGETACNSAIYIGGNVSGFTWDGGDQEDWATCYTSCANNVGLNPNADSISDAGQTNRPTNITIKNIVTKNYYSLDNNGSAGDHSEAWIIISGSNITFKNNTWEDCGPPASTGYAVNNSCNTAYIFFGQSPSPGGTYQTPTADYVTFEGNIIAPGHGQAAVHFDYDYPQGNEFHTSWLYNTIDGTFLVKGVGTTPMDPGSVNLTGANMTFVGNIAPRASYNGCFPSATYSHNLWYRSDGAAANCGPTDVEKDFSVDTDIWVDPANYNFQLLDSSGAVDAAESTYCPATDLDGTTRPQGSACDIGADEYVSPNPDTTAPNAPTGLTKTASTTSSISLSWNASTDPVIAGDATSGLAGYNIYRNGSFITEVTGLTNYTDSGLSAGTSYSYQVSAIDNSSNESAKASSVAMSTSSSSSGGTSTPASVKGDCNGDSHVTLVDLSILLSHYGQSYSAADFDGNGQVNLIDLSIQLSNYGK
jgi:hypothetical protein